MKWFILILPGLVVAYLMFLRPILIAMPALKDFYAEADGFFAKAWAVCGNSLTMLWSYFLLAVGAIWSQIGDIAAALGDPNFKEQISGLVGADPKVIGYFAMLVSAVTIAARLRSIAKAA